jgi:uncharacterized protein YkwD
MTLTKQKPRRPTATHRKVNGRHHKHSQHYIKAYWPYLPVFAVLGLGIVLNSWLSHVSHTVMGYATNVSSSMLLAETNDARATMNEKPLTINAELNDAAQAKANDMVKRNYWSHVTPDGEQPWGFMEAAGYQYQAAGENLAYGFGTSDQVISAWMNSAEHRANILNTNYTDVGFATANAPNYQGHGAETIVVAMYGQPVGTPAAAKLTSSTTPAFTIDSNSQPVSRLQMVTNATWIQLGLAAVCGAAIVLFFMRHALAWHKVLVRGEQFALHHPLFDVLLMGAAVFVFLLSHAAGTIL